MDWRMAQKVAEKDACLWLLFDNMFFQYASISASNSQLFVDHNESQDSTFA